MFGIVAVRRIARDATDAPLGVRHAVESAASAAGITLRVRTLVSDRISVPMMSGITMPTLLLPSGVAEWPAERLRVVVLHELAHVVRRDVAALFLTRVTCALYWFHPVAWSLERAARRECERACDDAVLMAGTRASDYAGHLLAIARALPSYDPLAAVTLAISRRSELEGRLLAILEARSKRGPLSRHVLTAAACATALLAIPLAAVRVVAQPVHHARAAEPRVVAAAANDWSQEGKSYLRERRLDAAIDAFTKAIQANPFASSARYNLACAYALHGDRVLALNALRDAVIYGYSDAGHMRDDSDLESIRGPELDAVADLGEELVITQRGDSWREAIPRYERTARQHPDIPRAFFNLGFVLLEAGEERRAIAIYDDVLRRGYRPATSMYNLACAYARLGERETSLQWLRRAQDAGLDVGSTARSDHDLDNVRDDPWLRLITAPHEKHKDKVKEKDKE